MILQLLGAVLFLAIILALSTALFLSFGQTSQMPIFITVCTIASLLSYFGIAVPLSAHLKEKWTASRFLHRSEKLKRRLVIALYGLAFGLSVLVFTLFMLDLISFVMPRPVLRLTPAAERLYRFLLPVLTTSLAASLLYKLNASTMLDRQKQSIARLLRSLNDATEAGSSTLSNPSPNSSPAHRDSERLQLEDLCRKSILAATKVGLRTSPPDAHIIAGIFLADPTARHFVPVATHGGSAAYQRAMLDFRPPFVDLSQLRDVYTEFANLAAQEKPRNYEPLFRKYRQASAAFVSNCGMVYALERNFIFGPSLYSRCIAHRFDFLDRLPPEEREHYMFEQSVGLPLVVLGRKVGVMLLLSNAFGTFYHRDEALYSSIRNIVSLGLRGLFLSGDIGNWIPGVALEQYPLIDAPDSERRDLKLFVKTTTHKFGWRTKQ